MARKGNNNLSNMADYIQYLEKAIKHMEQLVALQSDAAKYSDYYQENMAEISKINEKFKASSDKARLQNLKEEVNLIKEKVKHQAQLQAMQEIEIENAKELLNHEKELKKTKDQRQKAYQDLDKFKNKETSKINKQGSGTKLSWSNAGDYFTQNWRNRTQEQLFNDAYNDALKKAKNSKGEIDTSVLKEDVLEQVADGMDASSTKFNLASSLIQAGADTFKAGVDLFGRLLQQGFAQQKSAFRNNALTIGVMTQTTFEAQKSALLNINNELGSWMPYSNNNDLRDNVRTSEVLDKAGELAKMGTGYSEAELYTQAIDNIVTQKIVPYLDTSSATWERLVSAQPDLQKNIRGINATNLEIAGNNYITKQLLDKIIYDMQPMTAVAENDLAMSASGASATINSIMEANPQMTEEQAIALYQELYKQQYRGADILTGGSVSEKLAYYRNLDTNIYASENVPEAIGNIAQTKMDIAKISGATYNSTGGGLTQSIVGNALGMSGEDMMTYHYMTQDSLNKAINDGNTAQTKYKQKADKETQNFIKGLYQTTEEKQEIYMENLTNEVNFISQSLGHWGELIWTAVKGVGGAIAATVVGKGIAALAGSAGGGVGTGLLASGGGLALGAFAGAGAMILASAVSDGIIMSKADNMGKNVNYYEKTEGFDDYNIKDSSGNVIPVSDAAKELIANGKDYAGGKGWGGYITDALGIWSEYKANPLMGWGVSLEDRNQAAFAKTLNLINASSLGEQDIAKATLAWLMIADAMDVEDHIGWSHDKIKEAYPFIYSDDGDAAYWVDKIRNWGGAYLPQMTTKTGDNLTYVYPTDFSQYHRLGLNKVPYDNYPALLHEGEAVLTASTANELRNLVVEYRESNNIGASLDAIISNQTAILVTKFDEVIRTLQNLNSATTSSNWGSQVRNNMRTMTNTKVFG